MFQFFILSLLSLLYIFPIILVNLYYKDDLGWSRTGSIGLKGDGRPLGEYLVLMLCGGEPITDTAPLSLILLVLFLSYTLILYAKTNLDSVSSDYMLIPVLLLVITNPLAIECLSYKYGAIVMFTALALPFIIFSIPNSVSKITLFIYSSVLSVAFMSLYQPALGMCLILLIISVFSLLSAIRNGILYGRAYESQVSVQALLLIKLSLQTIMSAASTGAMKHHKQLI